MFGVCRECDLRFPPLEEETYVADVERNLYAGIIICPSMTLVTLLCFGCFEIPKRFGTRKDAGSLHFRCLILAGEVVKVALCIVPLTALCIKRFTTYCRRLRLEMVFIFFAAAEIIVYMPFQYYYLPRLFGRRAEDVFPASDLAAADFNMVLLLDVVTTVVCFMPIRSHVVWIVPACGLGSFSVVVVVAGSAVPQRLPLYLVSLMAMIVFALMGARSREQQMREKWIAQKLVKDQAGLLKQQDECIVRILNHFCDSLLHVGQDFRILHPSPQFAALLLHVPGKDMLGCCFRDCLASREDEMRFIQATRRVQNQDSSEMVHTRLKDTYNRAFDVQIYITCYPFEHASPAYFLGIVEPGERNALESSFAQPAALPLPTLCLGRARSRSSSSSSSLSGISSNEQAHVDVPEDALAVVLTDSDFSFVNCTPGFTSLSGPLEQNADFLAWLHEDDREQFLRTIGHVGNAFRNTFLDDLRLHPPNSARAGVEFTCCCQVNSIQYDNQGEFLHLEVVFSNVKVHRMRRKSKRRHKQRAHGDTLGATSAIGQLSCTYSGIAL